jgi:hypothetical protein
VSLGVLYTPTAVETDTAVITINFQDGTTDTVNLSGSGATSSYTYVVISAGTSTKVLPNGAITLPPANAAVSGSTAGTSSVIVKATNAGNANGVINSINAIGPFSISGLPPTAPTLKPGDTESFTITYTPTQVGPQTGTLVVGNDTFMLSAQGLGPQLTFTYGSGLPVGTGAVVFPSIAISKSEQVSFTVTNSGTTASTISLVSTLPPFSVPNVPPTNLAAGQSLSFPITFTPTAVGPANGTLLVNNSSVPLVAAGDAPPALPSYNLSGPSGTAAPASEASISLTLANSYPVDLNGVLTLTTSGSFGTDPAVQFITGNRTVNFVIPADSTSADFAGQGSQILVQTGTVAETVTLTPSFMTPAGVDVTPASPPTLQFTIDSSAPVLQSISVINVTASQTAASFTIVISGYSTPRNLNSLNISFAAASGFNLSASIPPIDLSGVSTTWFQSTASQAFGGLFQISIPFNLTGSVGKNQTLIQAIGSVSATVSNSIGTSNSVEALQ